MCGIAGTLGECNKSLTPRLIKAINHRGPDERPRYHQTRFYSGAVCRLAIVGRDSGSQPMLNDGGNVCISLNGEIYNHHLLRRELKRHGCAFAGQSDTEVVLHGYLTFGIRFVEQLEGMFAIAIFDSRVETLFLVRDRLGIKPLYYFRKVDLIAYSSEYKSFFRAGLSSGEVDEDYLAYRFVFNFGPINRTLFTDIYPVLPGTCLQFSIEKGSLIQRELDWNPKISKSRVAPCSRKLNQLILESVLEQIPQDVTWGVFLSGGVDSSILAYLATRITGEPPLLLTVTDGTESDDLQQARRVASFLGTEVIEVKSTPAEIIELLPKYILASEEIEPLSIFWYLLGRGARREMKVALCGQGADELFGGYPLHHEPSLLINAVTERFRIIKERSSIEIQQLISSTIGNLRSESGTQYLYDYFLREQLVSFQLNPVDKCTMAHGVEARVPYLSGRLVDYFRSSSPISRFKDETLEKSLLREAFVTSRLPTLQRKKQFSGLQTLPAYYLAVSKLADQLIDDERLRHHPFAQYLKGKLEVLNLDILLHILREGKAEVSRHFRLLDIYE